MKKPSAIDEIDRAIDRTIGDKDRAARIKAALHQQFDLTGQGNRGKKKADPESREDDEDFWDNVPL